MKKEAFKLRVRYCLAELESTETFTSTEKAKAELAKWKREARDKGEHLIGRVIPVNEPRGRG